jgi:hypothetical protein
VPGFPTPIDGSTELFVIDDSADGLFNGFYKMKVIVVVRAPLKEITIRRIEG